MLLEDVESVAGHGDATTRCGLGTVLRSLCRLALSQQRTSGFLSGQLTCIANDFYAFSNVQERNTLSVRCQRECEPDSLFVIIGSKRGIASCYPCKKRLSTHRFSTPPRIRFISTTPSSGCIEGDPAKSRESDVKCHLTGQ